MNAARCLTITETPLRQGLLRHAKAVVTQHMRRQARSRPCAEEVLDNAVTKLRNIRLLRRRLCSHLKDPDG